MIKAAQYFKSRYELGDSQNDFFKAAGFIDGRLQLMFHANKKAAALAETRWLEDKLTVIPKGSPWS